MKSQHQLPSSVHAGMIFSEFCVVWELGLWLKNVICYYNGFRHLFLEWVGYIVGIWMRIECLKVGWFLELSNTIESFFRCLKLLLWQFFPCIEPMHGSLPWQKSKTYILSKFPYHSTNTASRDTTLPISHQLSIRWM
jgi:hypothetical protein